MSSNFNQAITTLKNWVKIKSVKSEPSENAPFGENNKIMLEKALLDAQNLGFETKNYQGYAGEVIFGSGEDKDGLAILCHLDVVPEGDLSAWIYPPYDAIEKDGVIYGRGTVDNKGAGAICLYALKDLKDEGFIPSRKIKLIFGCDEESGMECIEYYKKVAVMPELGFSPDSEFPVIYAEKGILHIEYVFDKNMQIESIVGGTATNVVPDKASVTLIGEKEVSFYGKTAHGSTPECGDNAIKKALEYLVSKGLFSKQTYEFLFNGRLFEKFVDESGKLTFSPNVITTDKTKIYIKVDVRYPVHYTFEEVKKVVEKVGRFNCIEHKKPLYVDKNGFLCKTLMSVYKKHTGSNSEAVTSGGGTYARTLKKGVAFGPVFDGGAVCHVPNEKVKISDLEKAFNIYKDAIKELSK